LWLLAQRAHYTSARAGAAPASRLAALLERMEASGGRAKASARLRTAALAQRFVWKPAAPRPSAAGGVSVVRAGDAETRDGGGEASVSEDEASASGHVSERGHRYVYGGQGWAGDGERAAADEPDAAAVVYPGEEDGGGHVYEVRQAEHYRLSSDSWPGVGAVDARGKRGDEAHELPPVAAEAELHGDLHGHSQPGERDGSYGASSPRGSSATNTAQWQQGILGAPRAHGGRDGGGRARPVDRDDTMTVDSLA
jgi:hypothetical protein